MILDVKVIPQSRENALVSYHDGILKIRIQGTPVKEKVNKELIKFLSELLDVPKNCIHIVAGRTTPRKRLQLEKLEPETFHKRIQTLLERKEISK